MLKALAISLVCTFPFAVQADPILLMAEEDGCYWCAKWDEEIAHIYPKTAEGRTAPLQRFDVHHDDPDVVFAKRVHYTPTFILVSDGKEVGRIEGYPGEDFFWGMLSEMFQRAQIPLDQAS
jgi:thioredoxin-related protein